jgi:hypothetical protein
MQLHKKLLQYHFKAAYEHSINVAKVTYMCDACYNQMKYLFKDTDDSCIEVNVLHACVFMFCTV